MPPEILDYVAPLIALFGLGTFVMLGMWMRYKYKSVPPQQSDELRRLTDALEGLYDQTRSLRDEMTELQERMDFHERMLTRPRNDHVDTPA